MKSAEYWQKRAEADARSLHDDADIYIASLLREYDKASKSIKKDIEAFFGRYAINNSITYAETLKQLEKGELADFRMSLDEFIAFAKNNEDGRWTQRLNNVYYRTRISRLDALLFQIDQQVELLTNVQQTGVTKLLKDTYAEGYYKTVYEIHKGTGIGVSFARLDDRTIEKAIKTDWLGSNYSKRIWVDRDKLARELETNITQSIIRGDSLDKTIQAVEKRMDVSKSNAARLVQTEAAHIAGEATAKGYEESGVVQQYQFLATLDTRTSAICQSMDNRVFKLSEKKTGVNYPPLHPRCRSTTVAYFGDEEPGERIARDAEGNVYYVPDNMNYAEWRKKYAPEKTKEDKPPKANSLKSFEDEIRGRKIEYGAIFDKKGNKVWEAQGTGKEVDLGSAISSGKVRGNVITHNHPDNASFSRGDIKMLAQEQAAEIRAITPKFDYSAKLTDAYKKMKGPDKLKRFNAELDDMFAEKIKKYRKMIGNKKISVDDATLAVQHEMWQDFAKKTGWITYERKRVKEVRKK